MSLFGVGKQIVSLKESLRKAKENLDKRMTEESASETSVTSSSHIGDQIDKYYAEYLDGTATTSEIARGVSEDEEKDPRGNESERGALVLPRSVYNDLARYHNREAKDTGHVSQVVSTVHGGSSVDEEGNLVYKQPRVYTIPSDDSPLSSPPATSYGGSKISFPSKTQQSTQYGESIAAFPLSALPEDPFATPRASGTSILATRYIQSEENISMHAVREEKEEGMPETLKRPSTPTYVSDSEDDAMTQVEWRQEEVYMTPTKVGKKRNKGKGVIGGERPQTPDRPIPNALKTPSRRDLHADWAKPAEELMNEKETIDWGTFIGEYLQNTNGLCDLMVTREKYDTEYAEWCGK